MVEHGTENAGVDSSILSLGTSALIPPLFRDYSSVNYAPNYCFADILPTLVSKPIISKRKKTPGANRRLGTNTKL